MTRPKLSVLSSTKESNKRCIARWDCAVKITRIRFATIVEAFRMEEIVREAYLQGASDGRMALQKAIHNAMED